MIRNQFSTQGLDLTGNGKPQYSVRYRIMNNRVPPLEICKLGELVYGLHIDVWSKVGAQIWIALLDCPLGLPS